METPFLVEIDSPDIILIPITVITDAIWIAYVVQSNSATAQQSAASSQELSGQAELMKTLVKRFHLLEPEKRENFKKMLNEY